MRPTSPVHERDIADVAVRALLDHARRRDSYPVLGAGPVTLREQVTAIAGALGEPVRLKEADADTYRAELLTELPEFVVERLLQSRGSVPSLPADLATDAVPEVLGRPALTFVEWAHVHHGTNPSPLTCRRCKISATLGLIASVGRVPCGESAARSARTVVGRRATRRRF